MANYNPRGWRLLGRSQGSQTHKTKLIPWPQPTSSPLAKSSTPGEGGARLASGLLSELLPVAKRHGALRESRPPFHPPRLAKQDHKPHPSWRHDLSKPKCGSGRKVANFARQNRAGGEKGARRNRPIQTACATHTPSPALRTPSNSSQPRPHPPPPTTSHLPPPGSAKRIHHRIYLPGWLCPGGSVSLCRLEQRRPSSEVWGKG